MNSASVGSITVRRTHERWSIEERGGRVPRKRTSFHPERTLHMSIQSKYLKVGIITIALYKTKYDNKKKFKKREKLVKQNSLT